MSRSLLDRCDSDTIAVFDAAATEASRLGHNYVGTEHLLLELIRHRDTLPQGVATLLPYDVAVMATAIESILNDTPARDAELLKTLGIDLEKVRAAVRQTFGRPPSNGSASYRPISPGGRGGALDDGACPCLPVPSIWHHGPSRLSSMLDATPTVDNGT